jgi:hypothetical protein
LLVQTLQEAVRGGEVDAIGQRVDDRYVAAQRGQPADVTPVVRSSTTSRAVTSRP